MKQNDFYEVDGCTDFIPVKLIKEYKHLNLLEVESTESGYRGVVPHMYSFPEVDEPQKVTIPKFVADFYESIKDDFEDKVYDLCLQFNRDNGELSSEVLGWFGCGKNEPIQTLVKMKLYGYEIEQEKLYTVKVLDSTLFKMTSDNHVRYKLIGKNGIPSESKIGNYTFEVNLTEKEIKEADERLWQFAKPVEEK